MLENFLHQKYFYGGEIWKLGDIIIDLQKKASQVHVDKYIQGLLLTQEPVKPFAELHVPRHIKNIID